MTEANWWDLPDGTVVRDGNGEVRRVRHSKGLHDRPEVWLLHWSDEYAPVHDQDGLHSVSGDLADDGPVTVVPIGGKVTLRTNEDDWRELNSDLTLSGHNGPIAHCGHDVPEYVWLDLLRAAGVEVEIVTTDFGVDG